MFVVVLPADISVTIIPKLCEWGNDCITACAWVTLSVIWLSMREL